MTLPGPDQTPGRDGSGSSNGGGTDAGDPAPPPPTPNEPFVGRYVLGQMEAPIRIVMFSDYQCEDCQIIEKELHQLLEDARRHFVLPEALPVAHGLQ